MAYTAISKQRMVDRANFMKDFAFILSRLFSKNSNHPDFVAPVAETVIPAAEKKLPAVIKNKDGSRSLFNSR